MKQLKNMKNDILRKIILYALIIILIYILYCFITQKTIFGYTIFKVASGSMKNTLNIGDYVIVQTTKDIKNKDIIAYIDNEQLIIHRVIKKEADTLITKGDANNQEDDAINISQVIGKATVIIKEQYLKIFNLIIIITIIIVLIKYYKRSKTDEK